MKANHSAQGQGYTVMHENKGVHQLPEHLVPRCAPKLTWALVTFISSAGTVKMATAGLGLREMLGYNPKCNAANLKVVSLLNINKPKLK